MGKIILQKEQLIDMYINKKMTTVRIGKILGCVPKTVRRNLHVYNIKMNTVSEGTKRGMNDLGVIKRLKKSLKGQHHSITTEFQSGNIPSNKGKPMTQEQKEILRYKNLGKKQSQKTIRKRINSTISHHIYLKENSEKTMKVSFRKHSKLHHRAYDYLVEIGLIDNYITWFDNKYGLK